MKKKIMAMCLVIAMAATAIIGGTLAYFTDTDAQTNVFTIGNVKIDLFEDFNSEELSLMPVVGTNDLVTGYVNYENTIEKEVYVENTGAEDTYVRVHIAIPNFQRKGNNINVIGTNFDEFTTVDGKWIWGTTSDENYPPRDSFNDQHWNRYTTNINGVPYKVFVVTYETALKTGDITEDAINNVYMDSLVTQDEIAAWNKQYADEFGTPIWNRIYVVAEAGQAQGFDDAVVALNTQFGTPGEYAVDFTANAENKLWVDMDDARVTKELKDSAPVGGDLSGAAATVDGNHLTYTISGVNVAKTNNGQKDAYWLGYIDFTVPSYGDATKAVFTRFGEQKSFDLCKDTANTMQAWVAADELDENANITYTFDWDGDGVFEAIYTINATNLKLIG